MKLTFTSLLILAALPNLVLAQDHPAKKLTFERDSAIWIANIDGSSPKKLAGGQSPDLSPDGTKLAYNTVQDVGQPAHRQIAILDLATDKTTILKDIPSDNSMEVTWSPDGKHLLFAYYANNDRWLGIVNADGTGFRNLLQGEAKPHTYWSQTWAADGKSLFAQDMENLYQLDLNAKVIKKWTVEKLVPHGGMSGNIRLDASPDGKTLLMDVEMDEKERKGWDGPPPSVWTLDLATEKVTRLTPKTLYAWNCHWLDAPDSILFLSQKPDEETTSIYRMSVKGQGKDRVLLVKNATIPGTSR